MKHEELEHIEQTAFSMVVQALTDYAKEAATIFREEIDQPQDIAEDITREAVEAMGLPGVRERLYGKVDIKKAIYVFLPEAHPVALMLDAKAEARDKTSATIQMSQTSMHVKMHRGGQIIDEAGKLPQVIQRNNQEFYVVTVIAKFFYEETKEGRELQQIIVACIPNGQLQEFYNPNAEDTIWRVGRDAPTRGEDFRVRLNFAPLREKAPWRVREILLPQTKDTT